MISTNNRQMVQSFGLTQEDRKLHVCTPSKKAKLERSIDQRLQNFGCEIVNTITDGDCMLDALSKTFYIGEVSLVALRKLLINVLLSIGDFYVDDELSLGSHTRLKDYPTFGESHEQDASWDVYIKRMSVPGEWCDQNMLLAASIHFTCQITVIGNGIVDAPSHITPPLHWNLHMNSTHVIVLGHIQENHYLATKKIDQIPHHYRDSHEAKPAYVSLYRFWVEDRIIWCTHHKVNNDRVIASLNSIMPMLAAKAATGATLVVASSNTDRSTIIVATTIAVTVNATARVTDAVAATARVTDAVAAIVGAVATASPGSCDLPPNTNYPPIPRVKVYISL
jgi:hypothetical protein